MFFDSFGKTHRKIMRTIPVILYCLLLLPALGFPQTTPVTVARDEEIRSAVSTYVQQRTANLGCEIRIRRLSISGNTEIPAAALEYEVVAPQQWEGWGSANLAVIARLGDRVIRNIPVRVEVEALADMVVTVRQIDHGSILAPGDLAIRKQDISQAQGRFFTKIGDAVGKKARSTLRPNSPVKADQLEKVPLIKSGQIVTIVAENERMRITVTGKAKNAGAEGDTITVQNLTSLKEIPARVLDANMVAVVF